ncbi:MAG: NAD(P)H-binding protein [Candidatus Heimdallarchaeota archaeon]|nr:MAG: NAD(P)H-binding protein [Candidatus Heimdallarchaeota archaeon]
MKIIIIGGTGFLGYHSLLEFRKKGHSVNTISIPDVELGDWFPKEVEVKYVNVFEQEESVLQELLSGYDVLVYAVGPDDRVTPPAPAYNFFHERLVNSCGKIVDAARNAGIKRCVVLNSYFAHFDRIWPELRLAENHPYIKCRVEQAERVIRAGQGKMDVIILELPYIFGSMPGRIPLWKEVLLDRILKMKIVFFPKGGTNMIAVQHVAEAIVGAVERGEHGQRYLIGDTNLSWKEMLNIIFNTLGMKKRVITIPTFLATFYGRRMKKLEEKEGKEGGLDLGRLFQDIQSKELYYDPSETAEKLGYNRSGLQKAIEDTVRACYPDRF